MLTTLRRTTLAVSRAVQLSATRTRQMRRCIRHPSTRKHVPRRSRAVTLVRFGAKSRGVKVAQWIGGGRGGGGIRIQYFFVTCGRILSSRITYVWGVCACASACLSSLRWRTDRSGKREKERENAIISHITHIIRCWNRCATSYGRKRIIWQRQQQ